MNIFIGYFWLFILGSFLGFVVETLWCFIKNKKIESRKGLIYGHFIPVYGIAVIFITLAVDLFKTQSNFNVFAITFIICLLVEYICSFLQEKIFGTKSWDYKNYPLNINGRINLIYILLFSFLGLVWVKIYPVFLESIYSILNYFKLYEIVSIIFIVFMFYNITISILATYRQKLRKKGKKANSKLEKWLDKKYNDECLKKIYANAVFIEM